MDIVSLNLFVQQFKLRWGVWTIFEGTNKGLNELTECRPLIWFSSSNRPSIGQFLRGQIPVSLFGSHFEGDWWTNRQTEDRWRTGLVPEIFCAPVNGRYHFTFTAHADVPLSGSSLRVNGRELGGSSVGATHWANMPISATLALKKGDQVTVTINAGSLYDEVNHYSTTPTSPVIFSKKIIDYVSHVKAIK